MGQHHHHLVIEAVIVVDAVANDADLVVGEDGVGADGAQWWARGAVAAWLWRFRHSEGLLGSGCGVQRPGSSLHARGEDVEESANAIHDGCDTDQWQAR